MGTFWGTSGTQTVAVVEDFRSHIPPAFEPTVERATFHHHLWKRLELDGVPIYIRSDRPDWFVPNDAGDEVLKQMTREEGTCPTVSTLRFLERLPCSAERTYPGRAGWLKTDKLQELWFHITNECNQHCSRCLFEDSVPGDQRLNKERVFVLADQAYRLGCRFFVISGGEPLSHPEFKEIVHGLVSLPDCHVAVLTNATLLGPMIEQIESWPRERFHLQISLDGGPVTHDAIRGPGAFELLMENCDRLKSRQIPFNLSMCVESDNMKDLTEVVEIGARIGAGNLHCLWYFAGGRGNVFELADPDELFTHLVPACRRADELGLTIDNVEQIRRQVFGPCGMIYDGNNSGWGSLAIGPDGHLYPSPALVGEEQLKTPLDGDLASAWRQSPILEKLRRSTVAGLSAPMLMILGGGDQDHSYLRSGEFVGFDPYWSLYEKIALWLIAQKAKDRPVSGPPRLRLKMGEVIAYNEPRRQISLRPTKSLCAVISKKKTVFLHELYFREPSEPPEMVNHCVLLPESWVSHIPREYRVRSTCFSGPALEVEFSPGQRILVIGSDTGIDCLIASKPVGPEGRVLGIEPRETLLDWSQKAAGAVADNLGFHNVEFLKGSSDEPLPVHDRFADVVVVNCSVNGSGDKRRLFEEVFRVLRPRGRLVISDIVSDDRNDSLFCSENLLCNEYLAGALTSRDLLGLLDEAGLVYPRILKWVSYQETLLYSFYRVLLDAHKPFESDRRVSVMYRGPLPAVITSRGTLLTPGTVKTVLQEEIDSVGEDIFIAG